MESTSKKWKFIFLGFGILTVISGIYLIIQKDYLVGVSGSCVGVMLVYQNMIQIKEKESELGS